MSASPRPPPPPPTPLPPPGCRDKYGVGGIGKTMAAAVICRCHGKNGGLLGVLKVDDKVLAKGLDPEESYEELSKSLVHNSGGHPRSLGRQGSFLGGKSKEQWLEILEKLVIGSSK